MKGNFAPIYRRKKATRKVYKDTYRANRDQGREVAKKKAIAAEDKAKKSYYAKKQKELNQRIEDQTKSRPILPTKHGDTFTQQVSINSDKSLKQAVKYAKTNEKLEKRDNKARLRETNKFAGKLDDFRDASTHYLPVSAKVKNRERMVSDALNNGYTTSDGVHYSGSELRKHPHLKKKVKSELNKKIQDNQVDLEKRKTSNVGAGQGGGIAKAAGLLAGAGVIPTLGTVTNVLVDQNKEDPNLVDINQTLSKG